MLVGVEVNSFSNDTILHGLEVLRTLSDDDDVGAVLAGEWLAQSACRQQSVIDYQAMVIHQEYIYARFDIAVLEGVVEQYYVELLVIICQQIYTFAAVFAHCHGNIGEFLLHLVWLVTYLGHRRVRICQYEALAFTLVSTTENCYPCRVLQESDKIFNVRGLPCSANSDIAY